jgi:hypothetical protein
MILSTIATDFTPAAPMNASTSSATRISEEHDLRLPRRKRPEQSDQQSADRLPEIGHPGGRVAHRRMGTSPDQIFGRDTAYDAQYHWPMFQQLDHTYMLGA